MQLGNSAWKLEWHIESAAAAVCWSIRGRVFSVTPRSAATLVVGNGGCCQCVYPPVAPAEHYRHCKREIMSAGVQSVIASRAWKTRPELKMRFLRMFPLGISIIYLSTMHDSPMKMYQNLTEVHNCSQILSRWVEHVAFYQQVPPQRDQEGAVCSLSLLFFQLSVSLCFPSSGEDVRLCQAASASDHQGWNGERPLREEIYLFLVIWKICGF